jgi:hypothetical protein
MPRTRDGSSGRYQTTYADEDFIEAIEAIDGAATTTKIIDTLGCSQRLALDRLHGLAADGDVSVEKIGNAYVWDVANE